MCFLYIFVCGVFEIGFLWDLVAVVLPNAIYREPNAETLAAMKECASGVELEEPTEENIENLEEYIKTL